MKKRLFAAMPLVGVLVLIAGGLACATPTPPPPTDNGELPPVEIREYEGENLSSINHFRENSIKGPQYVDLEEYSLTIHGLVQKDVSFSYDDIVGGHPSYEKVVTLFCVEGWDVTLLWEGVLLSDLLNDAGVLPQANTVIFRSVDDYSTSLSLDYILDNNLLLAFKMNELTLPPERGYPFQLVAESKWGYKWIKWVNNIELSDDPEFRGFWESLGYSNAGNLDEYFFD